ncbi:MAG: hypothetical protein P8Z79_14035 [Sedimentisphaerales bacterium]|jgi:hypothetical protein
MAIERIVDRIIKSVTWLYYRQWKVWEVLVLGMVALIALMIVVRAHRKTMTADRHLHERTPRIKM